MIRPTFGDSNAKRSKRRKAPRRRNRGSSDDSADRHRRDTGQQKVGPRKKRTRGRKGARGKNTAFSKKQNRKKGIGRKVAVMRYTNMTRRSGMTPNGPKVREAILHIINCADARKFRVTQFDILKTLFVADREHLNRYGRPITFDDYAAIPDGPIPSLAYDVLKEQSAAFAEAQIEQPLWKVEAAGAKKKHFFDAARAASDDVLSESDFEELERALILVHKLGYQGTWDLVHADEAYKTAWAKRPEGSKRADMDYALLFKNPDPERAEEIKFVSAHV